jgi:hypothetical protein
MGFNVHMASKLPRDVSLSNGRSRAQNHHSRHGFSILILWTKGTVDTASSLHRSLVATKEAGGSSSLSGWSVMVSRTATKGGALWWCMSRSASRREAVLANLSRGELEDDPTGRVRASFCGRLPPRNDYSARP